MKGTLKSAVSFAMYGELDLKKIRISKIKRALRPSLKWNHHRAVNIFRCEKLERQTILCIGHREFEQIALSTADSCCGGEQRTICSTIREQTEASIAGNWLGWFRYEWLDLFALLFGGFSWSWWWGQECQHWFGRFLVLHEESKGWRSFYDHSTIGCLDAILKISNPSLF